jgi:hypothetical protein
MICLAQSKYAEAEDLNERALAIREKVFGKTHVRCALTHIMMLRKQADLTRVSSIRWR